MGITRLRSKDKFINLKIKFIKLDHQLSSYFFITKLRTFIWLNKITTFINWSGVSLNNISIKKNFKIDMVVGYEQIGWIDMWLDLYKKNLNPEIFWHAYIIFVVYSTEGWTDRRTWWINCEIIFLLWRRGYWYSGKKIKKMNC